jgi:DNA repair photolyase
MRGWLRPPPPPVNSYGIVAKYIYESDGPAGEYAPLTANPYLGCGHKCKYCFVPRVRHITREEFDRGAEAREQFISHLIRDAAKYQAAGITEQVLISFTSDPYHRFDTSLTRQTFEALAAHGLAFCALSKGGTRVLRDADIFRPTRDAYAFSLTSTDVTFSANWEPDAAPPADRMLAAKLMRDKFGLYVWNSLEPILDIEHTLRVVEATHGFVNLYKVGPVHYLGGKYSKPDLRDYTLRLVDAFTKHNARAYFKRDLQPFLPDGYPNPMRVPQHH